ncbi:MAG: hypothetical protein M0026_03400 [Nocardiopsaceae bacterium]|nr:hypothetical protein [Nocardiopsaceae bacterium]
MTRRGSAAGVWALIAAAAADEEAAGVGGAAVRRTATGRVADWATRPYSGTALG